MIITGLPTKENPETLSVFWKMIRDYKVGQFTIKLEIGIIKTRFLFVKVNHIVLLVDTRQAEQYSVLFPDGKILPYVLNKFYIVLQFILFLELIPNLVLIFWKKIKNYYK